jgi:hypothetical protein
MGIEFVRKKAKAYRRHFDIGRRDLGIADLFSKETTSVARQLPFDLAQSAEVHVGETVTVEMEGSVLIARIRLNEVGRAENPPNEILSAVQGSCGIAKGLIEQVHGLSRVVEISLC